MKNEDNILVDHEQDAVVAEDEVANLLFVVRVLRSKRTAIGKLGQCSDGFAQAIEPTMGFKRASSAIQREISSWSRFACGTVRTR